MAAEPLKRTPLYGLHRSLGAKLVPFAGYEMPVHYPAGILAEHLHTRAAAGLFDVSHMGQVRLLGGPVAADLEKLVPGDIQALKPGRMRYTLFTNEAGGILDDLMVTAMEDHLFLIVNAACKEQDFAHLQRHLGKDRVFPQEDRALLALQGPAAAAVLGRLASGVGSMTFMTSASLRLDGIDCLVSRSGYTGEDGFEISVPAGSAERLATRLLAEAEVKPIGLGARDSLRLEAGLCLYGHDLDEKTTVIEADLAWAYGKRRRAEGGFPGTGILARQLTAGASRKRVGILPDGRAPAREHTEIQDLTGATIGEITSGGFGPSVDGPIAMGYVSAAQAVAGTAVSLLVRGTPRPARVVPLPFVPQRYYRG